MSEATKDQLIAARTVWLFFAARGHPHMPVGVWGSREEAEAWISDVGATGTLAECMVGTSAWDAGIAGGRIAVPPPEADPRRLSVCKRHECEPESKFFYRDGVLIDLQPSAIDSSSVELRFQFRELRVAAQALSTLAESAEFTDAEFPIVYMMSREQVEALAGAVWKIVHDAARRPKDTTRRI